GRQDGRGMVVDYRVCRSDEVVQRVLLASYVQHHGPLVRVEVGEHAARGDRPGGTARPGLLDLDDLGAEVGEQLATVFPGHRFGELDDPDAVQCRHWLLACGSGLLASGAAQPPLGWEV